jgi:hypothetical protein
LDILPLLLLWFWPFRRQLQDNVSEMHPEILREYQLIYGKAGPVPGCGRPHPIAFQSLLLLLRENLLLILFLYPEIPT